MFPGRSDPDFGIFVKQIAGELEKQGMEIARAVADRRSGSLGKQIALAASALAQARRFRPDVVYAHYLVPAGAVAAVAAGAVRAPLVLTAHGRDVRNVDSIRGVRAATEFATRRAHAVVAVSDYLRGELVARIPELEGRIEVISSGVDLERFRGRDAEEARAATAWDGPRPRYLFVGTLDERKNVLRLAEAFERLGRGSLALVGDGPLGRQLEGRRGVRLVGRVTHERVADWIAACDVLCQPSLVEPFGQAILEAMASERSVVATRVGGPPEFVTPEAGVLVDPASVDSIEDGLRRAAELPAPNEAARQAAGAHELSLQASRVGALLRSAAQNRQRA